MKINQLNIIFHSLASHQNIFAFPFLPIFWARSSSVVMFKVSKIQISDRFSPDISDTALLVIYYCRKVRGKVTAAQEQWIIQCFVVLWINNHVQDKILLHTVALTLQRDCRYSLCHPTPIDKLLEVWSFQKPLDNM